MGGWYLLTLSALPGLGLRIAMTSKGADILFVLRLLIVKKVYGDQALEWMGEGGLAIGGWEALIERAFVVGGLWGWREVSMGGAEMCRGTFFIHFVGPWGKLRSPAGLTRINVFDACFASWLSRVCLRVLEVQRHAVSFV